VKALIENPVATRVAKSARRDPRSNRAVKLGRIAALCLAPAAVFLLILIAYPLSRVIWSAFHYVNLTNPTVAGFAGLDNFATVLEDEHFWPSVWHTGVWTVASVTGEYALGLASAVALAQPTRARSVFRAVIIIPCVIPIVVAGLNWTWMLTPDYGVLNLWMVKLGLLSKPFYWLGNLDTALLTVSFVNIWRSFPFYTISLLAALMSVPKEVIESAAMDGAGPLRRFVHITMPYLKTVSLTLIFIHVIWTAINFDFIWVMTQGAAQRVGDVADHDLSLRAGGLRRRRGKRAGDDDDGLHARYLLRLLVRGRALGGAARMVMGGVERAARASVTYATLAAFAAFCLFPFLWMLDTALKPPDEVRSLNPTFTILHPTLDNFRHVLTDGNFLVYFRNSVIVARGSTALALLVSVFCGYALSRFPRDPAARTVGGALLLSQMIPGVLLLAPFYILMRELGLLSTYRALIIVYCTFAIPLCCFMLKGFFDAVPRELEDAAEMDGCSRLGFIYRILLPLAAPGLLATALFCFVTAWNEFLFGYVLINDEARRTLTPGIMVFKGPHLTDWGALMAASVLAVVPVAIFFVYLQRFLMESLTAGAVKG
jgi:multiple sugar transport system permease protein